MIWQNCLSLIKTSPNKTKIQEAESDKDATDDTAKRDIRARIKILRRLESCKT